MSLPLFHIVAPKSRAIQALKRSLLAAGGGGEVSVGEDPATLQTSAGVVVFTTNDRLPAVREAMGSQKSSLFVLCEESEEAVLETAASDSRIGGLIAWGPEGAEDWEMRYLTRRLRAPAEIPRLRASGPGEDENENRKQSQQQQQDGEGPEPGSLWRRLGGRHHGALHRRHGRARREPQALHILYNDQHSPIRQAVDHVTLAPRPVNQTIYSELKRAALAMELHGRPDCEDLA